MSHINCLEDFEEGYPINKSAIELTGAARLRKEASGVPVEVERCAQRS